MASHHETLQNPPAESDAERWNVLTQIEQNPPQGEGLVELENSLVSAPTPETLDEQPTETPDKQLTETHMPLITTAEIERETPTPQKHIAENYKRLKKRRGEAFAKAVRGTLSTFADQPDFAEKVLQLIPNKHEAVATLQDNFDYINVTIREFYEKEGAIQQEAPKNPYELAKRAGYELAGPFDDAKQIRQYASDFRKNEKLCTFNDVEGRMSTYHILWLRHKNADDIPAADELTANNLTDEWKQYLKEINRYDQATDTYNLTNLSPKREDPYGTSSMSVQIARQGTHVSIKNRYNHTVGNPDSTLGNNLDRLVDGLRYAVYAKVGREDLRGHEGIGVAAGYIADNAGGLHRYYYEADNTYYGWYEMIKNGEVTSLPENEYFYLSPELYVKKSGDEVVSLDKNMYDLDKFELTEDKNGHKLACYKFGELTRAYTYSVDEQGQKLENLKLSVTQAAKVGNISDNPVLTSLSVEGNGVDDISFNSALTSISIANSSRLGHISHNPALTSISSIGELAHISSISNNPNLISLPNLKGVDISYISHNPSLTWIAAEKGTTISGVFNNQALNSILIDEGAKIERIDDNPALVSIYDFTGYFNLIPAMINNPQLEHIHFDTKRHNSLVQQIKNFFKRKMLLAKNRRSTTDE
ncbi:MAG: hypothetical protein LBQ02_00590 [Candidatus Nomurabacteria bacterium]|jgi:hypothetical protein|nr:hypothetical protein [Candidatus Nomurabacteria bacterium]